jgi:hypothetical protein
MNVVFSKLDIIPNSVTIILVKYGPNRGKIGMGLCNTLLKMQGIF